jgi:hypothetical protein
MTDEYPAPPQERPTPIATQQGTGNAALAEWLGESDPPGGGEGIVPAEVLTGVGTQPTQVATENPATAPPKMGGGYKRRKKRTRRNTYKKKKKTYKKKKKRTKKRRVKSRTKRQRRLKWGGATSAPLGVRRIFVTPGPWNSNGYLISGDNINTKEDLREEIDKKNSNPLPYDIWYVKGWNVPETKKMEGEIPPELLKFRVMLKRAPLPTVDLMKIGWRDAKADLLKGLGTPNMSPNGNWVDKAEQYFNNPEELVDQRIWVEEKGPGRVMSYNKRRRRRSSTHSIQFESTGSESPVELIVDDTEGAWRYLVEDPKPDFEYSL